MKEKYINSTKYKQFSFMRFLLIFFLIPFLLLQGCQKNHSNAQYRIARDPSWYPLNLQGKGSAIDGFSSDLIKEIALDQELNIVWIKSDWNLLFMELLNKNYDAILSSISLNDISLSKYSFSEPYLLLGPVLVVPINSLIQSLDQMQEKIIGVVGSTSDDLIAQTVPHVIIKRFESPALLFESLAAGQIDGGLVAILEAKSYIKDLYSGRFRIATPPLSDKALRLITIKDKYPELISAFNEGLDTAKQNKSYQQLLNKWSLNDLH